MLEYFKNAWSEGCYNANSKKVENMAQRNKSSHFGESEVFDLNATNPMGRALLSSDCNLDVRDVLSYELASVPPPVFTNDGMRFCKKPNLLSRDCFRLKFPEDMQALLTSLSSISQLFCSLDNPFAHGVRVGDFVENFKRHIASYPTDSDIYPRRVPHL